ncbi:MAG: 2-C-methyl-D-erythritol 4-phosphate cytidylyltransferase [Candidatus Omnitrophica bacterium]|nr:2-C-methyl-D-erythritol 4-phosphate cytidylyltransferase [Candidatus Omnitrophota bacterium]
MFVSAIILAAGRGERLKSKLPKPLVILNSKPVIGYSLKLFTAHPGINEVIIVANKANLARIRESISSRKVRQIVIGGLRRQDSVYNGLKAVDSRADLVLIHDSARPFIDRKTVSRLIREARQTGAAIVGVPLVPTVKKVTTSQRHKVTGKTFVKETLDRRNLWEVQTPQAFRKELLLKAYKKFGRLPVTDDAMLVEKLGAPVIMVKGSYANIKITTPEDLVIAKALVKRWKTA